ncbi:LuxR C-terminal-related transcriptional regulator [Paenarthrobacter sp. NPDC090520]|uniref:LuxR C-terminal-related transcriptional regulator n=1 Tax=Paenarthrobacter sp. NPDC090520 TaxID=3364382 RepID=UPI0037FCEC64
MTSELTFSLSPLEVPPEDAIVDSVTVHRYAAAKLFIERASACAPGFAVDNHEAEAIGLLCRRLDGLPLSIELAAARARTMTARHILSHLRATGLFDVLAQGDPSAPDRHRGLHEVIAWSRQMCTDVERSVWDAMSVFSAPTGIEAVRAVVGPDVCSPALELALDGLVGKAVIGVTRDDNVWFRMPLTTAEFARVLLNGSERAVFRERHRRHFIQEAQQLEEKFWAGEQSAVVKRLRVQFSDFSDAWDECIRQQVTVPEAAMLVTGLRYLWTMGGAIATGRRWLNTTLERLVNESKIRADLLWTAAWIDALSGDRESAQKHLQECASICGGNSRARAWWATWSGTVALFASDLTRAKDHFSDALERHDRRNDPEGQLMTLFQAILVAALLGESAHAKDLMTRALQRSAEVGDLWGQSYAIWAGSVAALQDHDQKTAAELAMAGLRQKQILSDRLGTALVAAVARNLIADPSHRRVADGILARLWAEAGVALSAFGERIEAVVKPLNPAGEETPEFIQGNELTLDEAIDYLCISLDGTHPTFTDPRKNAKLTSREAEVAELLGEGKSNKEIAAELVLSPRTVESHVEGVLRKFGLRSRAQVAAVLARQTRTISKLP